MAWLFSKQPAIYWVGGHLNSTVLACCDGDSRYALSVLPDAQPSSQWKQIIATGTVYPIRGSHGFVVAQSGTTSRHALFLFGGWNGDLYLNDVWGGGASATQWTPLPSAEWAGRAAFGYTTVADGSRVVITGGYNSVTLDTAWISNVGLTSWDQLPPPAFGPRSGHAMLTVNDNIYVIGGTSGATYYNDVVCAGQRHAACIVALQFCSLCSLIRLIVLLDSGCLETSVDHGCWSHQVRNFLLVRTLQLLRWGNR